MLLGNYAIFLKNIRKAPDAAEAMYKRALEADPSSPQDEWAAAPARLAFPRVPLYERQTRSIPCGTGGGNPAPPRSFEDGATTMAPCTGRCWVFVVVRNFLARLICLRPPWARIVLLLSLILLYGATAFHHFESPGNPELRWSDGLWYSLVTMTTVGYGDYFPKTIAGRFFVGIPLMFMGIGLLGYALSVIATALVSAKNKEMKGMSSFKGSGHLVLINYPGLVKVERIISELRHDPSVGQDAEVVLIDEDLAEIPSELADQHVFFVKGNPTRDATLVRAGIDRASHAVILCKDPGSTHSDSLNVTITLAIEARSKKIHTVVECVDPATEELLRKAGCDSIVCLSRFDAHFLSQELLNPGVQEVMDELLSNTSGHQIYLTGLVLGVPARRYSDLNALCHAQGHLVLGLRRSGKVLLHLSDESLLLDQDQVITIGAVRPEPFVLS